ncbi:MAG: hypothetical protein ACH254_22610, partial [Candidatus Thiodiazotropha endolucinida]
MIKLSKYDFSIGLECGQALQWCWVNFKCKGVLLKWIIVVQGPTVLVVNADIYFLPSIISLLSPYLWETTQYRLKYCLKEPLNPKQPTNQQ